MSHGDVALSLFGMKHLERYIEKQKSEYLDPFVPLGVKADMVVVIPCYDEPDLLGVLDSLRSIERPDASVLILVVMNAGVLAPADVVLRNRMTYAEVVSYGERFNVPGFDFFPVLFEGLPRKHAGVGLARKIGMDMAIKLFSENGADRARVIVSLDADCIVSSNFLTSIWRAYSHDKTLNATIHDFKHRVECGALIPEYAIRQYEAYLRYFRVMLKMTGFPYYYHTIGSAFSVSADAYVKVGGMGRQQGGEDFYFLQKVFALGGVKELNDVTVFPLARLSDRVPFGTGPSLQRIIDEPDGNVRAYSQESFMTLKQFFDLKDDFYREDAPSVERSIASLHPSLRQFLVDMDFGDLIADCNDNSASMSTFRKRFFHHFNAFRIIKYLNSAHPDPFPFQSFELLVDKY